MKILTIATYFLLVCAAWAQAPFTSSVGCSAMPDAAPAGKIASSDFVRIQSLSSCMDPCPIYTVRVRADGLVNWNGSMGVVTKGEATRQVSAEAAHALIESFRVRGFWRLCEQGNPMSGAEDGPQIIFTVRIGGREKSINGVPSLEAFRAVGILAGTYLWRDGNPELENVLRHIRPGSDFDPKPGATDLMRAASDGDINGIRHELAAGAKVNAKDASGFTALMYAAAGSHRQAVGLLLKAGADLHARSNLGQTALMAAVTGWPDPADVLRALIAAGIEVNVQDREGESALMLAVVPLSSSGIGTVNPAVISLLVDAGARRDLRDQDGRTAMDKLSGGLSTIKSEYDDLSLLDPSRRSQRQEDLNLRLDRLEQARRILLR